MNEDNLIISNRITSMMTFRPDLIKTSTEMILADISISLSLKWTLQIYLSIYRYIFIYNFYNEPHRRKAVHNDREENTPN